MSFLIVSNPEAGSAEEGMADRALHLLPDAEAFHLEPDADLGRAVDEAVRDDRVVVAAGGDGTVSACVQHLVGRGTLGVLPAGTRNHLARDLDLNDEEAALAALKERRTSRVDLGRLDDRHFINNVALGLYPQLVEKRERDEERIGRWPAMLRAASRVLREGEPVVGTIAADGDARKVGAWMVFVGNNRFLTTPGRIGRRERLDEGVLDLRLLLVGTRARLAYSVVRGRTWGPRRVVRREARRVELRLLQEGALAVDGEVEEPVRRAEIEIVPRALTLVVP
ncbi:MAG TPA: diacylglycerol kinase family protein [Actinomycetota bacterium]